MSRGPIKSASMSASLRSINLSETLSHKSVVEKQRCVLEWQGQALQQLLLMP